MILDDADFAAAIPAGVGAAYANSGQTCSALTRMIVPRSRLAEVEELARAAAESYTVGDPFADGTRLGPLISDVQRERVRGYIAKGIEEGATLVTGGADAPDGLDRGYFVRPTVFSNVSPDMTIAREEIFGPGAVDHPVRHRGGSGRDRQRHRVRARRRRVGERRAGAARRPQDPRRARCG